MLHIQASCPQPLILVVDDEMTIRLLVRNALEHAGFAVEEATNGREALAAFQQLKPDLVLLDVVMPEMDGFSACVALRQLPEGAHIPILMLTGLDDEASINRAYKVGATDFVTKPINWVLLGHRVRYLLRASRAFVAVRENEEILRQEAQVSATLARVGRELSSSLATPVIQERLCQLAVTVLGGELSHTLMWQPGQDVYTLVAGWGYSPEHWAMLQALTIPATVILPLLPHLAREEVVTYQSDNGAAHVPAALMQPFGLAAAFCLALRRGTDLIGIQIVGSREQGLSATPQQHRLALGIAQFASLALENARLLEQAESANRLKSDFLATVSHELRTPLHIIMGYKDLLLEKVFGPLTLEQTDILRRLERSAQELLELITTTLEVGRIEAGRLPVEYKKVTIEALLTEVEAETRALQQQTSLQFVWEVAPNLPPLITDPAKLKVVLKNLIGNAVKFTEAGRVTVGAQPKREGLELWVRDTGPGIAPDMLPWIFEAFRQGDQTMTRRYGGVGLGLYIVRRLLDLLGGAIAVESRLGQGSTFRVWLPLCVPTSHLASEAA
jgi:signal transduction histidine kinase